MIDPNITPNRRESVAGAPDKRFFVSMLTRDIELEDAIFDLIDNCIDGALRVRSQSLKTSDRFDGYHVSIKFDEKSFTIKDNCGGIPWDIAKDVAFKNGAPEDIVRPDGAIGTVGIGMKRAIFKMGKSAFVLSQTLQDSFYVEIPESWTNQSSWDFEAFNYKNDAQDPGTEIEIRNLHIPVSSFFAKDTTISRITDKISDTYSVLISKGFKVSVLGTEVPSRKIEVCFEQNSNEPTSIQPYLWRSDSDDVKVFLAVGYRGRLYEDDPLNPRYPTKTAGITIICNNRVVLPFDKTHRTGWGTGNVATFHNQFSSIIGIVDMWSNKIENLPITTTKNGVDLDSPLYRSILNRLMEAIKLFTSNTSTWKGHENEIKTRLDEAPRLDLSQIRDVSASLPWKNTRNQESAMFYKPDLPRKVKRRDEAKISYSKQKSDVAKVAEFLYDDEGRSPKEVGSGSFDYVLKLATEQ